MDSRAFRPVLQIILVLCSAMATMDNLNAQNNSSPVYRVDPFWPKPLPTVISSDGLYHQWVSGMVGASCIDSHDHVITVNRGFLPNGLLSQEGDQSIPAPPVVLFSQSGEVVDSWGDPAIAENGAALVFPHGIHGCFADHLDNIWIAGNADGVVQKWAHD